MRTIEINEIISYIIGCHNMKVKLVHIVNTKQNLALKWKQILAQNQMQMYVGVKQEVRCVANYEA